MLGYLSNAACMFKQVTLIDGRSHPGVDIAGDTLRTYLTTATSFVEACRETNLG